MFHVEQLVIYRNVSLCCLYILVKRVRTCLNATIVSYCISVYNALHVKCVLQCSLSNETFKSARSEMQFAHSTKHTYCSVMLI